MEVPFLLVKIVRMEKVTFVTKHHNSCIEVFSFIDTWSQKTEKETLKYSEKYGRELYVGILERSNCSVWFRSWYKHAEVEYYTKLHTNRKLLHKINFIGKPAKLSTRRYFSKDIFLLPHNVWMGCLFSAQELVFFRIGFSEIFFMIFNNAPCSCVSYLLIQQWDGVPSYIRL